MDKIKIIKEVVEVMKDLERLDRELNIKCKQNSEYTDMLKYLIEESDENLNKIINNFVTVNFRHSVKCP